LETIRNRDNEVARVIASLSDSTKAPVVISESDLDREALASAVAMKLAFGDVPEGLRNKRVFRLSLDTLARDAKTSEEFVTRLQSVLDEAAQAQGRIILFVDQLQEYAGCPRRHNGDSVRKGSHRGKSFADHWRRIVRSLCRLHRAG
jgi:ATP-dependent Clp protease ATP-binding subunit ClpB